MQSLSHQPRTNDWYSVLFDEGELAVSKEGLATSARRLRSQDPFFCLNPMAALSTRGSDVACYRNILVEFDGLSIAEQWTMVTEELEMPFSTCTFSGGRSLHFIIALEQPAASLHEYQQLVDQIYTVIGSEVDSACKNPSRLTRMPNALRQEEGGALQELIEVRRRVPMTEMQEWLRSKPAFLKRRLKAAMRAVQIERRLKASKMQTEGQLRLPKVYQKMVDEGVLPEGVTSRHEALTKLASWMHFNGYLEEEISAKLYKAQTSIGLVERDDVPGIMAWLERRVGIHAD